jgi:hypothetical protein
MASAKTLLTSADPSNAITSTANTTQYWAVVGPMAVDTTAANKQIVIRPACIISDFFVYMDANSVNASTTISSYKNSGVGNCTVSVPTTATGVFNDNTNTDSLTSGDKLCIQTVPGAGSTGVIVPAVFSFLLLCNDGSGDTVSRLSCRWETAISASATTYYFPLSGFATGTANTTETNFKVRQKRGGTIKNLAVNVSANSRVTDTTVRSRKNGGNGSCVVTLTALTTGFFADTTNSDTIAVGDDSNYSVTTGAETITTITIQDIGASFHTTDGYGECCVFHMTGTAVADAATRYFPISGRAAARTTSLVCETKTRAALTFSTLNCFISQNDVTSPSTLTLEKGGVDTAAVVSITASTTGYFEYTASTIAFTSTETA